MTLQLLAFAQTRDLLGFTSRAVECTPEETPRMIVARIAPGASLAHLRVALDCEYTSWDAPVAGASEMAIIPPVSGG